MNNARKQALLSWLALAVMAGVCAFLAFQQFRWTGDIASAERDRLRAEREAQAQAIANEIAAGIHRARDSTLDSPLVGQVWLITPTADSLELRSLKGGAARVHSEWPDHLKFLRDRMLPRIAQGRGGPFAGDHPSLIEIPRFGPPPQREIDWIFGEIDLDYLRSAFMPEAVRKHLGPQAEREYQVRLFPSADSSNNYYSVNLTGARPDATASVRVPSPGPRRGPPGFPKGPPKGPPNFSRGGDWQLEIRHLAQPLDTIVNRARYRNIALSLAMLGLLAAAAYALIRSTAQSQQLAALQMNFAAGMSHELRTPLTVIATAAYNLQGRLASNPTQVEKYARLIRTEAEKLTAIVEQVLQFSSTRAGKAVREQAPVEPASLIEESLQSSKPFLDRFRCQVEKSIAPDLPIVLGDAVALRHVLQNLLSNAAKYGCENGNWVGLRAAAVEDRDRQWLEIRIADRGPGIPKDELPRIFDAFYRGRQAIQDQIHGTGLGLNLAKSTIEAHGGTIAAQSEPMQGAEFIVRLPAAPAEFQDEFTHSFDRG